MGIVRLQIDIGRRKQTQFATHPPPACRPVMVSLEIDIKSASAPRALDYDFQGFSFGQLLSSDGLGKVVLYYFDYKQYQASPRHN